MKILLLAVACLLASVPAIAAPYWNVTPGPVSYVPEGGAAYETDVSESWGGELCWHYFRQGVYGYWEENYRVLIAENGDVYLQYVSCGTDVGGFDEGYVYEYSYYGETLLVPGDPSVGMSWQWPTGDGFPHGPATLTVAAREPVETGRKTVSAWRIDVQIPGPPESFFICNGALLPADVQSYWVAESLGVVKWVSVDGHEVVMDDAPNVVPVVAPSWGTLKSKFQVRD